MSLFSLPTQKPLSPRAKRVLAVVRKVPGVTHADIADCLGYTRASVSGFVDTLVERELVERKIVTRVSRPWFYRVYPTEATE